MPLIPTPLKRFSMAALLILGFSSSIHNAYGAVDTIATSVTGTLPESVAASPDGLYVYVLGFNSNLVYKYNASDLSEVGTVGISGAGYNMAISPDGSKLVVPIFNANKVDVISTSTFTRDAAVTTSGSASNFGSVAISSDSRFAWVTLFASPAKIVKIDLSNSTVISTSTMTGGYMTDIAAVDDSSKLYACDTTNNKIVQIRTSDMTIVNSILNMPCWHLSVARDESFAYVSPWTSNTSELYSFYPQTMTARAAITGLSTAGQVAFSGNGQFIYVAIYGNGTVQKFRTSDNALISTISGVISNPWHVAMNSAGTFLYVTSIGTTKKIYKINADDAVVTVTMSLNLVDTVAYRSNTTLTALVSSDSGTVTFYQGGKYMPSCKNVTPIAGQATCTYKPSRIGVIQISAIYKLSGRIKSQVVGELRVTKRATTR